MDTDDLPPGQTSSPIYTQPLYVAQIQLKGARRNMLVVPTLNSAIYAWDADNGAVIWRRIGVSRPRGYNILWYDDCGSGGATASAFESLPFAGILSTPVIDVSGPTRVMLAANYRQTASGLRQWWLHEIDLTNGSDISKMKFSGHSVRLRRRQTR